MSPHQLASFHRPTSSAELIGLLRELGDSALIIGGGTFVHGLEARGLLFGIEALIDIQELGLNTLNFDSDGLIVGATTNYTQLEQTEQIRNDPAYGAISDALRYPPVQIKNVGTVGGSISASCPFFDVPVAFTALDGTVRAEGENGTRAIALGDFFVGLFENALEEHEFTAAVTVPPQPANTASAFLKYETNANDLAIINSGVRVSTDESGACREARVVIGGGVGETIVRSPSAEAVLVGGRLDDRVLQSAGEAVSADIEPLSDHRASARYRTAIAKVLTERALKRAVVRLSGDTR